MENVAEIAPTDFRIVQMPKDEPSVVRPADPDATVAEIRASMSSCVVHLCGCD